MTTDDVSWWPDLVPGQFVRHHLVLADGSSLSVQASRTHYCAPRNDDGPWMTLEVRAPELVNGWSVDGSDLEGSWYYAFVPVAEVDAYIRERGGLCPCVNGGRCHYRTGA